MQDFFLHIALCIQYIWIFFLLKQAALHHLNVYSHSCWMDINTVWGKGNEETWTSPLHGPCHHMSHCHLLIIPCDSSHIPVSWILNMKIVQLYGHGTYYVYMCMEVNLYAVNFQPTTVAYLYGLKLHRGPGAWGGTKHCRIKRTQYYGTWYSTLL